MHNKLPNNIITTTLFYSTKFTRILKHHMSKCKELIGVYYLYAIAECTTQCIKNHWILFLTPMEIFEMFVTDLRFSSHF